MNQKMISASSLRSTTGKPSFSTSFARSRDTSIMSALPWRSMAMRVVSSGTKRNHIVL